MSAPEAPGSIEIHATAVAIQGQGVLLRGRAGTGKSDLALRLVDGGALLIADDRVLLERRDARIWVRPSVQAPAELRHRLEVRGLGIFTLPGAAAAPLALVADLLPGRNLDRLPGPQTCRYLGLELALVMLDPFLASAAAKLRLAARALPGAIIPAP